MSFLSTDKLIVLTYPNGAGGKFVGNCLSLSSQVFPMLPAPQASNRDEYTKRIFARVSAEAQSRADVDMIDILKELQVEVENDASDYSNIIIKDLRHLCLKFFRRYSDVNTRLDWIMGSLPHPDEGLSSWTSNELFSFEPSGFDFKNLGNMDLSYFDNSYFDELRDSSLFHFSTMHSDSDFVNICKYFPNCRQVRLINTAKWIHVCRMAGKGFRHRPEIGEIKRFPGGVDFNIETLFFEREFLKEIEMLYEHFGLPDYNPEAISEYYLGYMKLHGSG